LFLRHRIRRQEEFFIPIALSEETAAIPPGCAYGNFIWTLELGEAALPRDWGGRSWILYAMREAAWKVAVFSLLSVFEFIWDAYRLFSIFVSNKLKKVRHLQAWSAS
jgi:hypothetical protein